MTPGVTFSSFCYFCSCSRSLGEHDLNFNLYWAGVEVNVLVETDVYMMIYIENGENVSMAALNTLYYNSII
jgi:hypothetical protein